MFRVYNCCLDKVSSVKVSLWTLGTCDGTTTLTKQVPDWCNWSEQSIWAEKLEWHWQRNLEGCVLARLVIQYVSRYRSYDLMYCDTVSNTLFHRPVLFVFMLTSSCLSWYCYVGMEEWNLFITNRYNVSENRYSITKYNIDTLSIQLTTALECIDIFFYL